MTLCYFAYIAHKYDNVIVGLSNTGLNVSTRTPWNYAICGRYPDTVPNGTTVPLYCQDNLPPFRYVIVQRPLYGYFVACEIEVLVRGTRMSNINILISTTQADSCLMLLFHLHVDERLAIVLHDLLDYFLLGKINATTMMFSRLELQ